MQHPQTSNPQTTEPPYSTIGKATVLFLKYASDYKSGLTGDRILSQEFAM